MKAKGIPLAWCLSSEGTEHLHCFFLQAFKSANPAVVPKFFMTDKDKAQINAILTIFPGVHLLLCWWHVLHAWQQHFNIYAFPELWKTLKEWIRISDDEVFDTCWSKIQRIAPSSFCEYLRSHWMNETKYWSAVYRKGRTIHEVSDTNMLIEACVYQLVDAACTNNIPLDGTTH